MFKNMFNKKNLLVTVVIISAFVAMLNQTVLSVAQPQIMDAFGISLSKAQWLSTGYSLIGGILIPISAWMADRFNTKRLVSISLTIFLLGTSLAFFSSDFNLLLAGRLIQSVGAGVLSGLTMTILFSVFPKENRGTPTMLLGIVFGIAPAVGPTLGGYIVDSIGWHYIFGSMIPIIALDLLLAIFYMEDVVPHKNTKLDIPSVLLSTFGFGSILYGISMVSSDGWVHGNTLGAICIGALLVAAFVWRQLTIPTPMLNLSVFTKENFSTAAIISTIAQISMVAVEFVIPIYLQNARGLSALDSGLTLLPGAIVMFFLAPMSGKFVEKHRGRQIIIFGITLMTLSTLALSFISLTTPIWLIVLVYAIRNIGLTFALMPAGTVGMQNLSSDLISHGSASLNVVRQVGASMGTAVLVSILQTVSTDKMPSKDLLATNPEAFKHGINLALVNGLHATLLVATLIGLIGIAAAFKLKKD